MQHSTQTASATGLRYDATTIALHWLTVVLVLTLYVLSLVWGEMPRGTAPRHALQALHVSLGLVLTALLAVRLTWRSRFGRRLPPAGTGLPRLAGIAMHRALYLMLVVQALLGICWRIAQQEPLALFGLLEFPEPAIFSAATGRVFGEAHDILGNAIIVFAALHALAAIAHRLLWKDGVLYRMLPFGRPPTGIGTTR